jgi:hypothetical protein
MEASLKPIKVRELIMLQNFFKRERFKNHEDFFFEFFNNIQHQWIVEDRYIKANFEEFFSIVPLRTLNKLYGNSDIWFIPSSGRFSCAIEPVGCSVVMIFPEFIQMLRSFSSINAKAILAHELGHIFNNHSHRSIDALEAQVEADKFAVELGLSNEIEAFLQSMPESMEKRVRLSYLTSLHFTENNS